MRSRVTPGVSCTTAARLCVRRLIRVDLPTLGKPTIATVPASSRGGSRALPRDRGLAHARTWPTNDGLQASSRGHGVRAPELVHLDQKLEELSDPRLQQCRRLLVALAAFRQPSKRSGSPTGDRDWVEVARLPGLRAVDGDRNDRTPSCRPTIAAPGWTSPGTPDRWRVPRRRARARSRRATTLRIIRTASRSDSPRRTGKDAERADQGRDPGHDAPRSSPCSRSCAARRRRGRRDRATRSGCTRSRSALPRHALLPVDLQPRRQPRRSSRSSGDRPDVAATIPRPRSSSTRSPEAAAHAAGRAPRSGRRPPSTPSSVVSIFDRVEGASCVLTASRWSRRPQVGRAARRRRLVDAVALGVPALARAPPDRRRARPSPRHEGRRRRRCRDPRSPSRRARRARAAARASPPHLG